MPSSRSSSSTRSRSSSSKTRRIRSSSSTNNKNVHGVTFCNFRGTSNEELDILHAVIARENEIQVLISELCNLNSDNKCKILRLLLSIRNLTLDVVEAIALWRSLLVSPIPYVWNGQNYLVKVTNDLDWVCKCKATAVALNGLKLPKRNPFLTAHGLAQSIPLESPTYLPNPNASVTSRIAIAQSLIMLEEQVNGPAVPKHENYTTPILHAEAAKMKQQSL